MARITIKESDIRRYVRFLIREAYEVEAVEDPVDLAEREKMLSGRAYNRGKFPSGGKSFRLEREYRKRMGYPPLRKPHGGVVPYLIGADGSDMTPGNKPEAIAHALGKRKDRKMVYDRGFHFNGDDSLGMSQGRLLTGDEQLALTRDERAAYREKLRRDRMAKSAEENENWRKKIEADKASQDIRYVYDNEDEYGKFRWSDGIDAKGNPTRHKRYDFQEGYNSLENLRKKLRYSIGRRNSLDDNNDPDKRLRNDYDRVIADIRRVIKLKRRDAEMAKAERDKELAKRRKHDDEEPIVPVERERPTKMQDAIDAGYFDNGDYEY